VRRSSQVNLTMIFMTRKICHGKKLAMQISNITRIYMFILSNRINQIHISVCGTENVLAKIR
jgi:hypothetical protein